MEGLEPANDGVKIRCLTTWLHPIIINNNIYYYNFQLENYEQGGSRTPDFVVRSHAL